MLDSLNKWNIMSRLIVICSSINSSLTVTRNGRLCLVEFICYEQILPAVVVKEATWITIYWFFSRSKQIMISWSCRQWSDRLQKKSYSKSWTQIVIKWRNKAVMASAYGIAMWQELEKMHQRIKTMIAFQRKIYIERIKSTTASWEKERKLKEWRTLHNTTPKAHITRLVNDCLQKQFLMLYRWLIPTTYLAYSSQ